MTTLNRRKIGRTNLDVTELGLGGAPMGGFRATISDADSYGDSALNSPASFSALVAVGTLIAERPPHRTVRARLRHTAPTSGV